MAGAPWAKEAKHLPLELSNGSGNLESSPTRNTRDLLLKVVPTVARVSLHLLLNPPRSPRLRPLAGAAVSYRPVIHTPALQPRSLACTDPLGERGTWPRGDPPSRVFTAAQMGRGEEPLRVELEFGAVNPTGTPRGEMLGSPGEMQGAAACIPSSGIRFQFTWTVALWDLEIQGRCAHTQRAPLGAFIFRANEPSAGEAGGGAVKGSRMR